MLAPEMCHVVGPPCGVWACVAAAAMVAVVLASPAFIAVFMSSVKRVRKSAMCEIFFAIVKRMPV